MIPVHAPSVFAAAMEILDSNALQPIRAAKHNRVSSMSQPWESLRTPLDGHPNRLEVRGAIVHQRHSCNQRCGSDHLIKSPAWQPIRAGFSELVRLPGRRWRVGQNSHEFSGNDRNAAVDRPYGGLNTPV